MKTLVLIMIALSLSGFSHSAEKPVQVAITTVPNGPFICQLLKEEIPLSVEINF